ncbi:MAG: AraC family transcriptional regulator [Cyanobacteria bacterium P01_B01_bin.77]
MTIELTSDQFEAQFQETEACELQWDPSDELDITYQFDSRISQGWRREIDLRDGLWLQIDRHQQNDHLVIKSPEYQHRHIHCVFILSCKGQVFSASAESDILCTAGKYGLMSNGIRPGDVGKFSNAEPFSSLEVIVQPEVLSSFAVSSERELPRNLQHLIKSTEDVVYQRLGNTQPLMNTVLQQILHCPYQGMPKRMYLDSKVIELIALVLDHETTIQQEKSQKCELKPEQLERVHYARQILLNDLSNPPTLDALARKAGVNDYLLRQGFHQAFGTTVFGELQTHRLEMARQLLAAQNIKVSDVAYKVGYASGSAFARAFRREFGVAPKAYQKAYRGRVNP